MRVNPYPALLRQIGTGVAQHNDGAEDQAPRSPGLELDVLDGDFVDGEVEAVNCAFDAGVVAVGEDLG